MTIEPVPLLTALAGRPHYQAHVELAWSAWQERYGEEMMVEEAKAALVGGIADAWRAQRMGFQHIALLEHGTGQSYAGRRISAHEPNYPGGDQRDMVSLFLHPNDDSAQRDREIYPHAAIRITGSVFRDSLPQQKEDEDGEPLVAVSFHYPSQVCPEAGSAFEEFKAQVVALAGVRNVLGHGHPRYIERLAPFYERHGIEWTDDFTEVCARASVYAVDNSSTLFFFASLGRPVVAMNSRTYDLGIRHGQRFWCDASVGVNVWPHESLADAVTEALADDPDRKAGREEAVTNTLFYVDESADITAEALQEWLGGLK